MNGTLKITASQASATPTGGRFIITRSESPVTTVQWRARTIVLGRRKLSMVVGEPSPKPIVRPYDNPSEHAPSVREKNPK